MAWLFVLADDLTASHATDQCRSKNGDFASRKSFAGFPPGRGNTDGTDGWCRERSR